MRVTVYRVASFPVWGEALMNEQDRGSSFSLIVKTDFPQLSFRAAEAFIHALKGNTAEILQSLLWQSGVMTGLDNYVFRSLPTSLSCNMNEVIVICERLACRQLSSFSPRHTNAFSFACQSHLLPYRASICNTYLMNVVYFQILEVNIKGFL